MIIYIYIVVIPNIPNFIFGIMCYYLHLIIIYLFGILFYEYKFTFTFNNNLFIWNVIFKNDTIVYPISIN